MKKHLWLIFIIVGILLFIFGVQLMQAQTIAGSGLTIAAPGTPPTPPQGSTVRITGIGSENGPLFSDAEGDILKRALLKSDMPPGIAWLADTQVFTGTNTFINTIVAPSIRAPIGSFTIRNSTDTAWVAMFLDNSITMRYVTDFGANIRVTTSADIGTSATVGTTLAVGTNATVGGTLDITGLTTATGAIKTSSIRGITEPFEIRTVDNTRPLMHIYDHGLARLVGITDTHLEFISEAAGAGKHVWGVGNVDGDYLLQAMGDNFDPKPLMRATQLTGNPFDLTIYVPTKVQSKIGAQGYYSLTDPFTVYATDTVTPIMRLYDAGRNVIGNTGQNTYWEYNATGNVSGERLWRAGIVGAQFRIEAGDDTATTWSTLMRGTMSGGAPDGAWWGDTVKDVTPSKSYQTNLGRAHKYLGIYAAELGVETIVAQDTMATIGGRILVGPTTQLTADIDATQTNIYVKYNNLAAGDTVYAESGGKVEFFKVSAYNTFCDSAPGNCPPGITGHAYQIARNQDGTGGDAWQAGTAMFNTGKTGNGFIDIYSYRGVRAGTEVGPSIAGNVRVNETYNGWNTRWAVGNLRGLYQYGATDVYGLAAGDPNAVWIAADATYGFRGMLGIAQKLVIHPSGYVMIGEPGAGQFNTYIDNAQILMRAGAINRVAIGAGGLTMTDPAGTPKMQLLPGNLRFYDSSGTNYPFDVDANAAYDVTIGYRHLASTYPNINISASTGNMIFASGHTTRMQLDAGNGIFRINRPDGVLAASLDANTFRFYDSGGYHPLTSMGAGHVQIGYDAATTGTNAYANVHINNSGNAYFRQGNLSRMIIAASGGAMTWYAEDGATPRAQIRSDMAQFGGVDGGARFQISYGYALQAFDELNKQWFHLRSDQMLLGDWYTTGRNYAQITPTNFALCAAGYGCPLNMYSTGDIHANGNLYLTGGGNVTSSGNFNLGGSGPNGVEGLSFMQWPSTNPLANRSVVFKNAAGTPTALFGQDSNGSLRIRSMTDGAGTGMRLTMGISSSDPTQEAGLFMTREGPYGNVLTNIVIQDIPRGGQGVETTEIRMGPLNSNNTGGYRVNNFGYPVPGQEWQMVAGGQFYTNGLAGSTTTVFMKNSAGVNYCQMNFQGGLLVSHNCG